MGVNAANLLCDTCAARVAAAMEAYLDRVATELGAVCQTCRDNIEALGAATGPRYKPLTIPKARIKALRN